MLLEFQMHTADKRELSEGVKQLKHSLASANGIPLTPVLANNHSPFQDHSTGKVNRPSTHQMR